MGMPFKQKCYYNENTYTLSPQELHEAYIKKYFKIETFFGNAEITELAKNIQNFKVNKLLFGVNYMKNKIENVNFAPYSIFTRENTMFFKKIMKNVEKADNIIAEGSPVHEKNASTEELILRNSFVAEPFCTQDGYILNTDKVKVLFIRRYTLDLIYNPNMKIILNNEKLVYNYNKIRNNFYIGEIQTFNNDLELYDDTLKILKNPKITIKKFQMGNNCHSHQLYIEFNDKCLTDGDYFNATVQAYLFVGNNIKKKVQNGYNTTSQRNCLQSVKLSIEVLFQHVNSKYDGFKLCNYSCQKGIGNVDLNIGECYPQLKNTELISSVFSILGRSPIAEINEMLNNQISSNPLIGKTVMEILKNVAADHKNMTPLRFDNLTINILPINDCYRVVFSTLQTGLTEKEKKKFLPQLHREKTQFFLTTGKNIEFVFKDKNEEYNLLKM